MARRRPAPPERAPLRREGLRRHLGRQRGSSRSSGAGSIAARSAGRRRWAAAAASSRSSGAGSIAAWSTPKRRRSSPSVVPLLRSGLHCGFSPASALCGNPAVVPLLRSGLHCGFRAADYLYPAHQRRPAPPERAPLRPEPLIVWQDGTVVVPLRRSGLHCGTTPGPVRRSTTRSSRSSESRLHTTLRRRRPVKFRPDRPVPPGAGPIAAGAPAWRLTRRKKLGYCKGIADRLRGAWLFARSPPASGTS